MIYASNDRNHKKVTHSLDGVYAHGNLETFLGYDIITTDDQPLAMIHQQKRKWGYVPTPNEDPQVIRLQAQNESGERINVAVYIWHSVGVARGLVVSVHDKEAVEYAEEKSRAKAAHL